MSTLTASPLLSLRDVHVGSRRRRDVREIVRGVDLDVLAGEKVGVVGESGSGKTLTMLSVLRLLPNRSRCSAARSHSRTASHRLDDRAMESIRGAGVAMVYQDPMTSLNPLLRVRTQVVETLRGHGASEAAARRAHGRCWARVGFVDPERVEASFPTSCPEGWYNES